MANSDRRKSYTDRSGNMFIPMNVEGGYWNEHFITTPKLFCIAFMVLALVGIILALGSKDSYATPVQYIFWIGIWLIISSLLVRFVIFEEKFYYRMYKEMQKYEVTTPAVFWEIASIKDTDDGAILTYSDAKIGVLVRLERDTITGKTQDFKEIHYDAISDFYRSLATNKYSFVQMNIMEQAGKDPRLNELSKLISKSDNPNICKLMEMEIGHIKNKTNATLYENDYFLIYTQDMSKLDVILGEVCDSLILLLEGAYVGFSVLGSKEIVDLMKELYGVSYFNATQASLMMYDRATSIEPIAVTGLCWADGNIQSLNSIEKNKFRNLTSKAINGAVAVGDLAFKDALYRETRENKIGIEFEGLIDKDEPVIEAKQGDVVNKTQANKIKAVEKKKDKKKAKAVEKKAKAVEKKKGKKSNELDDDMMLGELEDEMSNSSDKKSSDIDEILEEMSSGSEKTLNNIEEMPNGSDEFIDF